jgi:hypothetical protein
MARIAAPRAAVLLFADEPGSLLAAFDTRADIRLMVYDGKAGLARGATPNLRKAGQDGARPADRADRRGRYAWCWTNWRKAWC